jgi:hypothetical protein
MNSIILETIEEPGSTHTKLATPEAPSGGAPSIENRRDPLTAADGRRDQRTLASRARASS